MVLLTNVMPQTVPSRMMYCTIQITTSLTQTQTTTQMQTLLAAAAAAAEVDGLVVTDKVVANGIVVVEVSHGIPWSHRIKLLKNSPSMLTSSISSGT
jgi:hypothetical protein